MIEYRKDFMAVNAHQTTSVIIQEICTSTRATHFQSINLSNKSKYVTVVVQSGSSIENE